MRKYPNAFSIFIFGLALKHLDSVKRNCVVFWPTVHESKTSRVVNGAKSTLTQILNDVHLHFVPRCLLSCQSSRKVVHEVRDKFIPETEKVYLWS